MTTSGICARTAAGRAVISCVSPGPQVTVATPVDTPSVQWSGLSLEGTLAARATESFETPVLAAGTYEFQMSGRGDADLYVRVGKEPSDTQWDCRPYRAGKFFQNHLQKTKSPSRPTPLVKFFFAS